MRSEATRARAAPRQAGRDGIARLGRAAADRTSTMRPSVQQLEHAADQVVVRLSVSPSLNRTRPGRARAARSCARARAGFRASVRRAGRRRAECSSSSGLRIVVIGRPRQRQHMLAGACARHGSGSYHTLPAPNVDPARVRREALAVARCAALRVARRSSSTPRVARVVQRAAAKRREARAEDRRRHRRDPHRRRCARASTATASLTQRQHQAVREIGRRGARRSGRLDGLAVAPHVEAFAALAAELRRPRQRLDSTSRHRSAPNACGEDLADVHARRRGRRRRRARSGPSACRSPRPRDRSARAACLPARREHRLAQVRHQHAVDEEAGRAAAGQRQLVDLAREGEARPARCCGCVSLGVR